MPPIYIAPMPTLHQAPQAQQRQSQGPGAGAGSDSGGGGGGGQQQPQTPGARTSFRPPWVKDAAAANPVQAAPWTLAARRDSLTRTKPPITDGVQPPVTANAASVKAPPQQQPPNPQKSQQPQTQRTQQQQPHQKAQPPGPQRQTQQNASPQNQQPPQSQQNSPRQAQLNSQPQSPPQTLQAQNRTAQPQLQNKTQQQAPAVAAKQPEPQQQAAVRKQSKITIIPSQPQENGLSPTRPVTTVTTATTTTPTPHPPGPPRKTSTPEQSVPPPGPPTRKVSTPEQKLRQEVINAAQSTKEQLRLAKEQLEHVPRLSRLQRQDSVGEPRVRPIQLESRQRSAPPKEENEIPAGQAELKPRERAVPIAREEPKSRENTVPITREDPKPRERISLPALNREEPKPKERTTQIQKDETPSPKPRERPTLQINKEPPSKNKVPWEQPNLKKVEVKMDSPTKKTPPTPPIMVQLKPPAPPPPMPPPPMPKPPSKPIPPEKSAKLEALRSRPRKRPDWGAMMKDIEQGRRLRHVQCNDRSSPLIPKIKVKDKFMYESEKATVHNQLLKEIQSGIKLKRVQCNDRSKPQLDGLRKFRRQMTIEEQIQKAEVEPEAAEPDELDDIDKVRDDLQSTKQMLALELRNKEAVERENKRLQAKVLNLEAEVEKLRAQQQAGGQSPAAVRTEQQQEIKKLREQMHEAQKTTEDLEKKYHDTAGQLDMARAEVDDLQRKNQALERRLAALKVAHRQGVHRPYPSTPG